MALNAANGQLTWTKPALTSKAASLNVPLNKRIYEMFY